MYTFAELDGELGVKNGIIRRAKYEFNLELELNDLELVQKIIYFKPMDHKLLAENELGKYYSTNRRRSFLRLLIG